MAEEEQKKNQEQQDEGQAQEPELDENRPNFTIGYQKTQSGDSDKLVAKSNSGQIDSFEVAIMMLHATANNVLGLLNQLRAREEAMQKAIKESQDKKQESEDKTQESNEKDESEGEK